MSCALVGTSASLAAGSTVQQRRWAARHADGRMQALRSLGGLQHALAHLSQARASGGHPPARGGCSQPRQAADPARLRR